MQCIGLTSQERSEEQSFLIDKLVCQTYQKIILLNETAYGFYGHALVPFQ